MTQYEQTNPEPDRRTTFQLLSIAFECCKKKCIIAIPSCNLVRRAFLYRRKRKRNLGKERYRVTGYSIFFSVSIFNYVKLALLSRRLMEILMAKKKAARNPLVNFISMPFDVSPFPFRCWLNQNTLIVIYLRRNITIRGHS